MVQVSFVKKIPVDPVLSHPSPNSKFSNAPFVGYYKIFKPSVMIRDPEMIKNVLVKDQASFSANDFAFDEKVDPLLAHNPFMVDGERWKKARQLLTPIFTGSKMKQLFPIMDQVSSQFVDFVGGQCGREVEAKSVGSTIALLLSNSR